MFTSVYPVAVQLVSHLSEVFQNSCLLNMATGSNTTQEINLQCLAMASSYFSTSCVVFSSFPLVLLHLALFSSLIVRYFCFFIPFLGSHASSQTSNSVSSAFYKYSLVR